MAHKAGKDLEKEFIPREEGIWNGNFTAGFEDQMTSKDIVRQLIKKSHPNLATFLAIYTSHRQRVRIMSLRLESESLPK